MKKTLRIFKIGGKVIDHAQELATFLNDFSALPDPKILIHGGGGIATQMADRLGIVTEMIEGRRVTTQEMLDVVLMVYGGLVNKKIVAQLQSSGCNAIGLTGADMNCMEADKRPAEPVDYGFAGDVRQVNAFVFEQLLQQGVTPVLAPLTHNKMGQLLNTNADTIAASVAVALAPTFSVELFYCFEKPGVLTDIQDGASLLEVLDQSTYRHLKAEGVIADGMIPKLDNAFHTLQQGVSRVFIMHHRQVNQIGKQHFKGTTLCL